MHSPPHSCSLESTAQQQVISLRSGCQAHAAISCHLWTRFGEVAIKKISICSIQKIKFISASSPHESIASRHDTCTGAARATEIGCSVKREIPFQTLRAIPKRARDGANLNINIIFKMSSARPNALGLEGPLSKWTNVMKGWQYRWFVLDQQTGLLSYYTVSISEY